MMSLPPVKFNSPIGSLCLGWLCYLALALLATVIFPDMAGVKLLHQQSWVQLNITRFNFLSNQLLFVGYLFFIIGLVYGFVFKNAKLYTVSMAYWIAQILGSGIIVNLGKFLFGHARPSQLWTQLPQVHDLWLGPTLAFSYHGFPSGHTCDYLVTAMFVGWLIGKHWAIALLFCFAMAQGALRVLLAKHFPIDVLGGAAIGGAVTLWVISHADKYVYYPNQLRTSISSLKQ